MNAQTNNQSITPIIAVLATNNYHQRKNRQKQEKRAKNTKNFDSLFQTACDIADDATIYTTIGCYGKDAKPVVGTVSSFNRKL